MAEVRHDKDGKAYLLLSPDEVAQEKAMRAAEFAALPETPEGWVEFLENEIARWRAAYGEDDRWRDPGFDNWRLWVEYQRRKRAIKRGTDFTAMMLPDHIRSDGTINVQELAAAVGLTLRTVRGHLRQLEAMGVDLTQLRRWPHPLRQLPKSAACNLRS